MAIITGEEPEVEMAEYWADQEHLTHRRSRTVVTSVQTQNSGMAGKGRMSRFEPDAFALLVIDEAHHATAQTYRRMIDHCRSTATSELGGASGQLFVGQRTSSA